MKQASGVHDQIGLFNGGACMHFRIRPMSFPKIKSRSRHIVFINEFEHVTRRRISRYFG